MTIHEDKVLDAKIEELNRKIQEATDSGSDDNG